MNKIKKPICPYFGGKWRLAPWIISHFPEHAIYVEAYGGAGSVLLRKPISDYEIYNDLNNDIVNAFKVLRDNGEELKEKLRLTPYSRVEFNNSYLIGVTPMERARQFFVRANMGYGSIGSTKENPGFSTACSVGKRRSRSLTWKERTDSLDDIVERLRGVTIENLPALELIKVRDHEQTLFYIDPPYLPATRKSTGIYHYEMDKEGHMELAETLNNVKGRVVVSGYRSELYDGLYENWKCVEKQSRNVAAKKRIECLWIK